MKKKSILWTLFLLMIVLFSGCIQQKVAGSEILDQKGNDVFSNETFMFEMKIPEGWKSDVMFLWQL